VRSRPGAARTILLFHVISARPSKQPRMVGSTFGVYSFGLIFVSARTNTRHHHLKHSIPGQIYAFRTHNLRHPQQSDLEKRIIRGCKIVSSEWSPSEPLPQPKYLERVLITNREKSFGQSLHVPLSNIWWLQQRPQPPPTEPTRHTSYIDIAGSDIDRPDLFKPAPYLLADNHISTKCLFRIPYPT
jgi:hypothetical protein